MSKYPKVKEEFYESIKKHNILSKDQKIIFDAFSYCTGVALSLLSEPDVNKDFIIAALLHDTVENTDTTIAYLEEKYGNVVATVVKALTKLPSSYRKEWGDEKYYKEGFFGPIAKTSETYPFIWKIKLADRFNNLQTYWQFASPTKKEEYVWETHEILRYSSEVNTPLKEKILDQLTRHYS